MKHSRPDYQDRIVDLKNIIPEDEPVFLLRGQDLATPTAIHAWAQSAVNFGANPDMAQRAHEFADRIKEYQKTIGGGHIPDVPAVAEHEKTADGSSGEPTGKNAGEGAGTDAGSGQANPPKTADNTPSDIDADKKAAQAAAQSEGTQQ